MDKVLSYLMFGFAVVTIVLAINILRSAGSNYKDNFLFVGLALSSSIWSVGFGFIPVQESEEIAYILRCIGMAGMFSYLVFVTFFLSSMSGVDNVIARVVYFYTHF